MKREMGQLPGTGRFPAVVVVLGVFTDLVVVVLGVFTDLVVVVLGVVVGVVEALIPQLCSENRYKLIIELLSSCPYTPTHLTRTYLDH